MLFVNENSIHGLVLNFHLNQNHLKQKNYFRLKYSIRLGIRYDEMPKN